MSMKFDLASDLHINHYAPFQWSNVTPSEADTLIIAGDMTEDLEETADFLFEAKKHYKNVCYVDGNHDHYQIRKYLNDRKSVSENEQFLSDTAAKDGWTYLQSNDLIIDDTVIIGANGWYSWNTGDTRYTEVDYRNAWKQYMSDSRLIKFDTMEPNGLAERDAKILSDKVLKYDKDDSIKNIICVTHTIPILACLTIKQEKSSSDVAWNLLGASFYNHFNENINELSPKVKLWCFGHTHFDHDVTKNHTRFLCHPRGYPGEPNSSNYRFNLFEV